MMGLNHPDGRVVDVKSNRGYSYLEISGCCVMHMLAPAVFAACNSDLSVVPGATPQHSGIGRTEPRVVVISNNETLTMVT
jgi:hypothetical protein